METERSRFRDSSQILVVALRVAPALAVALTVALIVALELALRVAQFERNQRDCITCLQTADTVS